MERKYDVWNFCILKNSPPGEFIPRRGAIIINWSTILILNYFWNVINTYKIEKRVYNIKVWKESKSWVFFLTISKIWGPSKREKITFLMHKMASQCKTYKVSPLKFKEPNFVPEFLQKSLLSKIFSSYYRRWFLLGQSLVKKGKRPI